MSDTIKQSIVVAGPVEITLAMSFKPGSTAPANPDRPFVVGYWGEPSERDLSLAISQLQASVMSQRREQVAEATRRTTDAKKPPAAGKPPRGRPTAEAHTDLAMAVVAAKRKRPDMSDNSIFARVAKEFDVSVNTVRRAFKNSNPSG
jgi:hypothetical protein